MTGVKLDEELTCQLYATIPLGSLTDDHEIVKGSCTLASLTGVSGAGAGGGAAKMRAAAPPKIATVRSETQSPFFIGGIYSKVEATDVAHQSAHFGQRTHVSLSDQMRCLCAPDLSPQSSLPVLHIKCAEAVAFRPVRAAEAAGKRQRHGRRSAFGSIPPRHEWAGVEDPPILLSRSAHADLRMLRRRIAAMTRSALVFDAREQRRLDWIG